MKLHEWYIVKCNNEPNEMLKRRIVYADLNEFVEEEGITLSDITVIPIEEWKTDEMIEITEGLLEDINQHKTANSPGFIIDIMKQSGISEENINKFMHCYMTELFNKHGY